MKTKVIIVIGPPGTGKGTQCKILAEKYGMLHFSTGDLCREYAKINSDIGREISEHLRNGNFVPDPLITRLINVRLEAEDSKRHGVLLDGYPRTFEQSVSLLNNSNVVIDRLILIQSPDNICVDRMLNRRSDSLTGHIYNLKYPELTPTDAEIVQRLIRRDTDVDETFVRNRLRKYHRNVGSILQNFKGKIFAVNGEQDYRIVSLDIDQCLTSSLSSSIKSETEKRTTKRKTTKKPKTTTIQPTVQQCVICMSAPSNFLVVPCGHKCGCESCLTQIQHQNRECPICRTQIMNIVQVFESGVDDEGNEGNDEGNNEGEVVPMDLGVDEYGVGREGERDERDGERDSERDGEEPHEGDGGWSISDLDWRNQQDMSSKNHHIQVNISPCEKPTEEKRFIDVAITVNVPDIQERVPIDVCCVIDISGSMGDNAKFQDPNDETKTISEGVTILDLTKHAVKTVIETLTENDSLSIVSFDDIGEIVFPLMEMDTVGKTQATNALKLLKPRNNTNLWAGLECGLNSLRNNVNSQRKKYVLLLTDGQPNQSPPKGEHSSLKTYYETYPAFKCQVNTFGFGYSLKSQILLDIATEGRGTFSFIPDAKIVGTCFINSIANAACATIQNATLHLLKKNNNPIGQNKFKPTPWGFIADLGPLHFGQSRNIVVPIELDNKEEDYLDVVLEYDSNKLAFTAHSKVVNQEGIRAQSRTKVVDTIYKVIDGCSKGNGLQMLMLARELNGYITGLSQLHAQDVNIVGLCADVSGRIQKSISTTERFNRWGQHYLRSINRAHDLQICTNFMDMGLQAYSGTLFKRLVEIGGEIFKAMPLEKSNPSQPQYNQQHNQQQYNQQYQQQYNQQHQQPSAQPSAQTYYAGNGGGCFDESTELFVKKNGVSSKVKITDVRKGDKVHVYKDDSLWTNVFGRKISEATVKYVVKYDCGFVRKMVKFLDSGITLTGSHPIRVNGKWQKPKDLVNDSTIVFVDATSRYVYNLVLDQTRVGLLINGAECVTFGHEFRDAWHPIFASNVIINTIETESKNQGNPEIVSLYNKL